MKKLLLTTAAVVLAAPAFAADMPRPVTKAPVVQEAIYSWTGFYIGGHAGGGWSDTSWLRISGTSNGFDTGPGSIANAVGPAHDIDGFIGGGQVGYLWQSGAVVFGLEGSWSGSDLKGSSLGTVDDVYTTKIGWLFLGTARLGFAANRWLVYGKGGFAAGSVKIDIFDPTPGQDQASSRKTHSGWTVGAGLEYALTQNWTLGVEYNYVNLDSKSHSFVNTPSGLANVVNVDLGQLHTVWGRLNYKFGGRY